MKWFSRKPTKSPGDESSDNVLKAKKYLGGEFLDLVFNEVYKGFGDQRIDNLYRAFLLGGNTGARLMLTYDQRCLEKWGKGDQYKATRLLEVWASTIMLIFLQRQEDQDEVLSGTADGFAMLFHSDPRTLYDELLAYREARKAEEARRDEGGLREFSNKILYLRTLKALGDKGVPDFALLPVPWGTLAEVLQAKPDLELDWSIFTTITNGFLVPDILISSLDEAKKTFAQLEV